MFVACFFCLTLPLRKNLLGSKRKDINIYFTQEEDNYKQQSWVLVLVPKGKLSMNRGTGSVWLEEEITGMRLVESNESDRACKTKQTERLTSKTNVKQM